MANDEDDDDNDFLFFAMIYLHHQASQKKPYVHSRYQKRFYKSLSLRDRRRRFGYYPRFVLHDPIDSAWAKLYRSEHDPSLIQATGLDFLRLGISSSNLLQSTKHTPAIQRKGTFVARLAK